MEKDGLSLCVQKLHLNLARYGIFNKHAIAFDFQDDLWAQAEDLLDRLDLDVDGTGLLRPLDFDAWNDPLLQRCSTVKVAESSIGTETGRPAGNGDMPFSTRSESLWPAQFDVFWIGQRTP